MLRKHLAIDVFEGTGIDDLGRRAIAGPFPELPYRGVEDRLARFTRDFAREEVCRVLPEEKQDLRQAFSEMER